ncbi:MAG: hypothetical protein ACLU0O_06275 [Collinsella sp.]
MTEEEEHACRLFADYMAARAACVAVDEGWAEQAVEKSVRDTARISSALTASSRSGRGCRTPTRPSSSPRPCSRSPACSSSTP